MDPINLHYSLSDEGTPRAPQDPQDTWLDADHHDLIQQVLDRDTSEARTELATQISAALVGQIEDLSDQQSGLGTAEQIDAIRRTGWCPWARVFLVAAMVIVLIDTVAWWVGAARLFVF